MKRYFRVWFILSLNSFQTFFESRFGGVLFLVGKIVRFCMYLGFLLLLVTKTQVLAGFTLWEVLLFYLTFQFIDAATQMLFREVYRFREQVVRGYFDLVLVKPVNALFRSLFGGADILDLLTLVPFILFISVAMMNIGYVTALGILLYIGFVINSLFIAMTFHIMVLSLAILTTEIDHAIMIYRDFTGMGKIPIDIYTEPLRSFVTFIIPVGIMMTFPVKAFLGILQIFNIVIAVGISITLFSISIFFWRYALDQYTSASS